jgi:hypothetical protein
MRGSSHILILNLAICDLITPTISIPFDLAYEEMHYAWPFGAVVCKVLWPGQTFTTTSSALILTAICIDRYRALVYPFKVRWAGKFCLMLFTMYTCSVAVVVPYMLVLHLKEGFKVDCWEKWPSPQKSFRQAYTIVLFLCQYALPLMIMITLYSATLRSLYNNARQLLSETNISKTGSQNHKTREECRRDVSLQELRKEQHLKVTKMFITVVIVFAVSMFPNQILWLWVDFGNLANNTYFPVISIICRIFTYSNSVLNPFIYGLYSKDFRSGYKKAGRKISKGNINKRLHFNGTRKLPLQTSYISQGIDEAKNLITVNKHHSNYESNQASSIDEKKVQFEEDSQEPKERRSLHSMSDKKMMDTEICLKDLIPEKKRSSVCDSTKTQGNKDTLSTDELENETDLGVEEDSTKRAAEFPINDNQKRRDCNVITGISNCIDSQPANKCNGINQGNLKVEIAAYLDELMETQC